MTIVTKLKVWAKRIKFDGVTLWFAAKSPATPWYAKALGLFVVAYAFSPIDLISDFIPVLGFVDDVLLLPALIWVTIRLLPAPVVRECREVAMQWLNEDGKKPQSLFGAGLVIIVWAASAFALWLWLWLRSYA